MLLVYNSKIFKKISRTFGGTFDITQKQKRILHLDQLLENPNLWKNQTEMQKLNKEKVLLQKSIEQWQTLNSHKENLAILLETLHESSTENPDNPSHNQAQDSLFKEFHTGFQSLKSLFQDLDLKTMLAGPLDANNTYLTINAGAGGTDACDWVQMLLRMYIKWAENQNYKVTYQEMTMGEEAGIKSVTILIQGEYAYGYLKCEKGIHRLVRISPFDSNARRHTSFAAIDIYPEIDERIQIDVKQEDLRIDTYRASGAGGQHVNKTDSAVRITHQPTGTVVQCQSERSQHSNRDRAMKMLRSVLYEKELEKRQVQKAKANAEKMANEWGSQIRSYVMHPYQLVKDHRTGFETGHVNAILDGDITPFIHAFLRNQTQKQKSQT